MVIYEHTVFFTDTRLAIKHTIMNARGLLKCAHACTWILAPYRLCVLPQDARNIERLVENAVSAALTRLGNTSNAEQAPSASAVSAAPARLGNTSNAGQAPSASPTVTVAERDSDCSDHRQKVVVTVPFSNSRRS